MTDDGSSSPELAVDVLPLQVVVPTIHRFPQNLQRIGTESDYIAPKTVALGPYHHGAPELQAMEEVKRAAVGYFFDGLGGEGPSREEAEKKMVPVAREARGCYADAGALAGITDDEFATMMFVDGCFLVQLMDDISKLARDKKEETCRLSTMIHPYLIGVMRDIILLENQIPWSVVEFLMNLRGVPERQAITFLAQCLRTTTIWSEEPLICDIDKRYKPSHLLCLIRSNSAGRSKHHLRPSRLLRGRRSGGGATRTKATELAEIGILLRPATTKFSNIGVEDVEVLPLMFARLSLVPLYLDSVTACWLVNMAAFEMYTETVWTGDCAVNSYLAVIAMLMSREEDVRELRAKGIVEGFSDQSTLDFFQGISPYLCTGNVYLQTIVDLELYKSRRWPFIVVYRFLYKKFAIIATVLSIVGVLVGIYKTIYSLKHPTSG